MLETNTDLEEVKSPQVQDLAARDLSYAFEHCHRTAAANKARCAYYLIPVKMLLGELPQQAMLDKFGLHDYSPIVKVRDALSFHFTSASLLLASHRVEWPT